MNMNMNFNDLENNFKKMYFALKTIEVNPEI